MAAKWGITIKPLEKFSDESGFTLVELAIVLVIIGLIIGGVLVGQDMIKASEIRGVISQGEAFRSATSVFKDKYSALPGDINQQKAIEFGFYDRSSVAPDGNGDGNGVLGHCGTSGSTAGIQSCERVLYWRDLSSASLIEGNFTTATNVGVTVTAGSLFLYFPESKIDGAFWMTGYVNGRNYLFVGGLAALAAAGAPIPSLVLSPFQAYNIDRKIDDSRPTMGIVRPYSLLAGGITEMAPAAPAAGICVSNVDSTYNQTTEAFAQTPACRALRFIMQ